MEMSDRLRLLRMLKKMTQKEVAEAIELSKSAVVSYEKGDRKPSIDSLISLCRLFNTSSDYIIGLSNVAINYPVDMKVIMNQEKLIHWDGEEISEEDKEVFSSLLDNYIKDQGFYKRKIKKIK